MRKLLIVHIILLSTFSFGKSTWEKRADFPNDGRHRATAIAIGNKGYMGLGHYNGAGPNIVHRDWWEYDLATNAWSQKADYPGGNSSGTYAALAFGIGNYGYVGGGQVAPNSNFYRYDPSTNNWTQMANSPTVPMNTQGFVIGDKGYYMSGSSVYEYNSTTNQWSTKSPAPFSISTWPSTFTIDSKGYVKSGTALYEYKATTDSWILRSSFPGSATAGSVGFSQYGKGYIVTGYAGWLSEVVSEVWEFDPATNAWTQHEEFLGSSRRFACSFEYDNRCFMGIGTNGTNFSDFWEFDAIAGLKTEFEDGNFTCYPNPATTEVKFKTESGTLFTVKVMDASGNIVYEKTTENGSIELLRNGLPSGTYFYEVFSDQKKVRTDKFIFI